MKVFSKIIIPYYYFFGLDLNPGHRLKLMFRLTAIIYLVGDQINLTLAVSCPTDYIIDWPQLNDTIIAAIEILQKSKIDTSYSTDKKQLLLQQVIRITSFDSGYYVIPPIPIKFKAQDDQLIQYTETEAILLEVSSVPVNMEEEIKDIKAPLEAPYTFREALPWIIGLLLSIAIGFAIYYYLKKRKKEEPVFKVSSKPKIPPHRIALDALDNLRHKKVWQSGLIKDYHTELTDIVREYISNRFYIHALEMTTDEILDALNATATNDLAKQKIRQTFTMADLVKFAKMQPLPLEHDTSLNNAIDFVKETMHLETPENKTNLDDQKFELSTQKITEPVPEISEVDNSERKEAQDV